MKAGKSLLQKLTNFVHMVEVTALRWPLKELSKP